MFKKPFKVKSQVQLKSTERKKLGGDLQALLPTLTEEDIAVVTGGKDAVVKVKILTFNEEIVDVYLIDKVPMVIEILDAKIRLPTVYMCWKFPHVSPTFTTHGSVLEKLKNGADLFLPGVYQTTKAFAEGNFVVNKPAAVNTHVNNAVLAVGLCTMSKSQMMSPDSSFTGGKVLKLYHTVGDHLCKLHPVPTPQLGRPILVGEEPNDPVDNSDQTNPSTTVENDPVNCQDQAHPTSTGDDLVEAVQPVQEGEPESTNPAKDDAVSDKEKMNELTQYCFLKAVKFSPKTIYPILPAKFYANHMLSSLPADETLNIKKTKWKKFSEFLLEKANEGILKLETIQKNEYRIVSVDTSHPIVREFCDIYNTEPVTVEVKSSSTGQPSVQQVYSVTAATLPLFAKEGLKKSDELTRNDVRNIITDYVKREGLQDSDSKDRVKLDPILYQIFREENLTRADLLSRLLEKMSVQHKVSAGEDVIVHKGKMPLIEFEVVTRSGNKKVTLISNLESYGVDVSAFAKDLQQKAAASTSVNSSVPGKKGPQLQVQGNQILHAAKLLDEKFGVKDKFMRGLEKAPKSRKK